MQVKFLKWGNSLALRVPNAFAKELGAAADIRAEMSVEDGALIVKVMKSKQRRSYLLDELVAQITPENRHPELEWGPPVGNEIW